MTTWDERFREGDYPTDPEPSPVLRGYLGSFPGGRALDVATGTGRNAVFLAEHGYAVDALDQSREGLRIARENAAERGVEANWIQADATAFDYPEGRYDVVAISYFRVLDRLGDLKEALAPGGVLFYQHHLRADPPADVGPRTDRYRFRPNELLHACLDLTVLHYEETTDLVEGGRRSATATVVARNSHASAQSYPPSLHDQ